MSDIDADMAHNAARHSQLNKWLVILTRTISKDICPDKEFAVRYPNDIYTLWYYWAYIQARLVRFTGLSSWIVYIALNAREGYPGTEGRDNKDAINCSRLLRWGLNEPGYFQKLRTKKIVGAMLFHSPGLCRWEIELGSWRQCKRFKSFCALYNVYFYGLWINNPWLTICQWSLVN